MDIEYKKGGQKYLLVTEILCLNYFTRHFCYVFKNACLSFFLRNCRSFIICVARIYSYFEIIQCHAVHVLVTSSCTLSFELKMSETPDTLTHSQTGITVL